MHVDVPALIFILVIGIYLAASIRISQENERFAVYRMGRFMGLKGPGLALKMPGATTTFVRLSLGEEGEIQSNELALFSGNPIPYQANVTPKVGTRVRIVGFDSKAVVVDAVQQVVVCEKCGHKNVM